MDFAYTFVGDFQLELMQDPQMILFDDIWDVETLCMWLIVTDRRLKFSMARLS